MRTPTTPLLASVLGVTIPAPVGCTRASHDAMKAEPARFFLSTSFAFNHDGAEFRNCNDCGSTLTLAVFCEECGRVAHATDRMHCNDGRTRHAVCAFEATRQRLTEEVTRG